MVQAVAVEVRVLPEELAELVVVRDEEVHNWQKEPHRKCR